MERLEHAKVSIRAKVEHPFHVVKIYSCAASPSYKAMARNIAQMFSLFGFASLLLARRWLCDADSQIANPVISGLHCVIFCITLLFSFLVFRIYKRFNA